MTILIATGVFALIFGFLFLFSPATITQMAEWSNRMVARTDDFLISRKKPVGVFLVLAGLFMLGTALLR
jgi:hypothetical protein